MRNAFARLGIVLVALLMASGLLAPLAHTQSAAAASRESDTSLTATVVGPPAHTVPAVMLVQLGSQTLAVTISDDTKLERHFGGEASLSEFADGDQVEITGDVTSTGINASRIINQSVQSAYTGLQGTISAINPPGVVPTTITLMNLTALGGSNAPYPNPLPGQINLPVSSSTRITINGNTQPAANLIGQLSANDVVTADGVYDRVSNQFDYIIKITKAAPPPPVALKLTGTLAVAPTQFTAPATLCVKVTTVTAQAIRPNVSTVSPCASGLLPVNVAADTKLQRRYNESSSLVEFSQGDELQITGSLINFQLNATLIVDTAIHLPTVKGTVQSITANGNLTDVTVTVAGSDSVPSFAVGAQAVLPLTNSNSPNCTAPSPSQFPCTTVQTSAGTTNGYNAGELVVGQTVSATGVYNVLLQRFIDTQRVVASAPPPPVTYHLKGTLGPASSQAGLLCVQAIVVTSQAIRPNVQTVNPCGSLLPVYVTADTKIQRLYNEASSLMELSQGDALTITATLVNAQLTASLVVDTAIHLPTVNGTVASITANGNVTNVVITVTSSSGGFAKGSQVTLPLMNSGSPNCTAPSSSQLPCTTVQTASGTTNGYNPGELVVSQAVSAIGVYNLQLNRFVDITSVKGSSITPPRPVKVRLDGTLAANPAQLTAPVVLCLRVNRVLPNAAPNVATTCPSGQLAVSISSSTKIVRRYYGASGLDQLNQGDSLQVTGVLANGLVTASLVRDLSIQEAYTSLVGTVGFVNFRSPQYFTVRVTRDEGRKSPFRGRSNLVIYVNSNTQIVTSTGTTNQITVLNPGQTVTVLGVYNRHRHAFTFTFRVRVH
ncbi:MAG TPA: hypothetical protein VN837_19940 [Chloroflexota bacterium]|nr:hypothetical protein [Chloroflexota bacterium]